MKPIKTQVTYVGQPYVDDPVYERIEPKPIADSIHQAFNQLTTRPYGVFVERKVGKEIHPVELLVAYQHTKLNWIHP